MLLFKDIFAYQSKAKEKGLEVTASGLILEEDSTTRLAKLIWIPILLFVPCRLLQDTGVLFPH